MPLFLLDQLAGLPAHALIVHAAVVLVPLAALGSILLAAVPRLRAAYALPVAAVAVAGALAAILAAQSGDPLRSDVRSAAAAEGEQVSFGDHPDAGAWARNVAIIFGVAAAGAWGLHRFGAGRAPERAPMIAFGVAAVPAVLASLAMIRAGHTGTELVWKDNGTFRVAAERQKATPVLVTPGATASPATAATPAASASLAVAAPSATLAPTNTPAPTAAAAPTATTAALAPTTAPAPTNPPAAAPTPTTAAAAPPAPTPTTAPPPPPAPTATPVPPAPTPVPTAPPAAGGTTLRMTAGEMFYSPAEVRAAAGSTLIIQVQNTGELRHTLTFPTLRADTGTFLVGQTAQLTLTALPAGRHRFICTIGSHEEQGMVGTLVVE